jgi:hypothetical protein
MIQIINSRDSNAAKPSIYSEMGAPLNRLATGPYERLSGSEKFSLFIKSIESGDREAVVALIAANVKVEAGGNIALITACRMNNVELIEILVRAGAKHSVESFEPLAVAIMHGSIDAAKFMLSLGSRCDRSPKVMSHAVQSSSFECFELAVTGGGMKFISSTDVARALHLCQNAQIVDYLISYTSVNLDFEALIRNAIRACNLELVRHVFDAYKDELVAKSRDKLPALALAIPTSAINKGADALLELFLSHFDFTQETLLHILSECIQSGMWTGACTLLDRLYAAPQHSALISDMVCTHLLGNKTRGIARNTDRDASDSEDEEDEERAENFFENASEPSIFESGTGLRRSTFMDFFTNFILRGPEGVRIDEIVQAALERNCDDVIRKIFETCASCNSQLGAAVFIAACARGFIGLVHFLISMKVDTHTAQDAALLSAVYGGERNVGIISLLVAQGGSFDGTTVRNAYMHALHKRHTKTSRTLEECFPFLKDDSQLRFVQCSDSLNSAADERLRTFFINTN